MLRDVFRSDLLERLNLFAWSPCCLLFACWLACLLRVSLRFGFQLVSQDVFLIATCRFCSRVGLCKCYPLCMRIRLSTGLSVLVCVCVLVCLCVHVCVCVCVRACLYLTFCLLPIPIRGSYINLAGLGFRQLVMLKYCVELFRILKDDHLKEQTFLVPSERSPRFVKALPGNRMPTCTPKARWIVVSFKRRRISLIAVPEFFLGQQLHLHDFFGLNVECYRELFSRFSYSLQ